MHDFQQPATPKLLIYLCSGLLVLTCFLFNHYFIKHNGGMYVGLDYVGRSEIMLATVWQVKTGKCTSLVVLGTLISLVINKRFDSSFFRNIWNIVSLKSFYRFLLKEIEYTPNKSTEAWN